MIFDVSETSVALYVSKRVPTLPLYSGLELSEVDRIADIILECRKKASNINEVWQICLII